MHDVVIIGAGAGGITAAIYAARAGLDYVIVSKDVGGLTLWSSDIENYTGFHNLTGVELIEKFKEHMADYDIEVKEEAVEKVEKKGDNFSVKTNSNEYETKTVIVASGSSPRKLNVPGEEEFNGKGVAYCATCDGPLFMDKDAAVIGGGDGALDAANTLIQYVKKCYILARDELTGTDIALQKKVLGSDKVEIIKNAEIKEIMGDDLVTGIKYGQDGEKNLDVQGVFVEIGHIRNTKMVKGLVELNDKDEIITDKNGMTSQKGIFAVGDVTDLPGKQTVIAAGDGARALLSAFAFISKNK